MSRQVFVDTSAWYALADSDDNNHEQATGTLIRLVREGVTLLTTNHVAGETYTLLRYRLGAVAAREFLQRIRDSTHAQRVFVPEDWEEAAEDELQRFADHDFSYVDAISFVTMRRLGLTEAFAFDRHFLTAGFILLDAHP